MSTKQAARGGIAGCLVALLLACSGPPVASPLKATGSRVVSSRTVKPNPMPILVAPPAPPLVPLVPVVPEESVVSPTLSIPTQAPLIANRISALSGIVRAPASLIGNNGGGLIGNNGGALIGNNGGGLISDNGGAYRLTGLLETQQPLAGVRVALVDAAGRAVLGANGAPLTTMTDADGAYSFAEAPRDRNLLVTTELAPGAGQLVAVAPRGVTAVNLDLIATLTTGYIYAQYVAWQADPAATLEKLPPEVEAQTREACAGAFTLSGQAVPTRLGRSEVAQTVQALRGADPAFDAQWGSTGASSSSGVGATTNIFRGSTRVRPTRCWPSWRAEVARGG